MQTDRSFAKTPINWPRPSANGVRILVTGVTGTVGWGVAHAALSLGADVVAVVRRPGDEASVRHSLPTRGKLRLLRGDLADGEQALRVALQAIEEGPIDHVVVAVGPWWQKGSTVEQSPEEYRRVRSSLLDAQVHAAMAFLPLVRHRAGASYTIVTGVGGQLSVPGTGLLVIAVNGVFALSRTLREEHAEDPVAVHELMIATRVERDVAPGAVAATSIGDAALELMRGMRPRGQHRFTTRGLGAMG